MQILCTICARSKSKGLKNKNFLKLNSKSLISYSIDTAIKSNIFNQISISTDSNKIKNLKKKYKKILFIKRPKNLASDKSSKVDAIRHTLISTERSNKIKYDIIFDLDVTSPLRSIKDLKNSLNIFLKKKSDNLISVTPARRNPYFNMVEIKNKTIQLVKKSKKKITRRQDAPKLYDLNASIYIWKRKILLKSNKLFRRKTSIYVMPYSRSVDIDHKIDLKIVKSLLN
tara:strand:+ start:1535 stop:2218 length:684 start_codon:yes stop_codon:yes gene_type:complete